MINDVYINMIIAQAQRAAADYSYRISKDGLQGEESNGLWRKLDVCVNGAACLQANNDLTNHEKQIIVDKLVLRGGISGYGTVSITFTPTVVANYDPHGNHTGMVTSVGLVTTVVTNANLVGPITSVGNTTSVTPLSITYAMQEKLVIQTKNIVANNYNLAIGEAGKLTLFVNAVGYDINILGGIFTKGDQFLFKNKGVGIGHFIAGAGVTIESESSLVAFAGQYAGIAMICEDDTVGAEVFSLFGNLA